MNTTTPTTTPTFSSLLNEVNPWAENHPYAALNPALRRLHSTLAVLHSYILDNGSIPTTETEVHLAEVIQSAVIMAACCCEHANNLEAKMLTTKRRFRAISEQLGEEMQA